MRSAKPLAYSLMACAALLWAGNIVLGRAASVSVPPIGLSFWRWAIAFTFFLPFVLPLVRQQWAVMRREWRLLVVLGLLGVAGRAADGTASGCAAIGSSGGRRGEKQVGGSRSHWMRAAGGPRRGAASRRAAGDPRPLRPRCRGGTCRSGACARWYWE